jgi:hypothetical protein
MEPDRLLLSRPWQEGTAARALFSRVAQRHFLSQQDRLPVAKHSRALRALGHGLSLLPTLEAGWVVGSHSRPPARACPVAGGAPAPGQRGDHRQPKRQEQRDQAGNGATMRARRSTAASGICWWTRSASCCWSWFYPPTFRTAMERGSCSRPSSARRRGGGGSNTSGPTAATRERC